MSKARRVAGKIVRHVRRPQPASAPTLPPEPPRPDWLKVLTNRPNIAKDDAYRVEMTVSCRDADYIPKVKNAGRLKTVAGRKYQVMHNGLLVEYGGYFGDWMGDIIKRLKGHHEPQEEKLFHEILKRVPRGSAMIELGSYWAYYSLWFNKDVPGASNYCCEPDPENLKLGQRNASINKASNMHFIAAAAGSDDGKSISFQPQEDASRPPVTVPMRSVDSLAGEHGLKKIGVVHMDVQGAELSAIKGAADSLRAGRVRFLFVSTHHYSISGDPLTHERCIELIEKLGGHIVAEHAIHESFSGDGLIVASFHKQDKDLRIDISTNRMKDSLFRSYTEDLDALKQAYEEIR